MSCDSLAEALGWGHERVLVISDEEIGLQAVVAIHSTVLGPALGGLRHWRYERGLVDAVEDALRLSRAMTLKASAAGLDLGGGKAVMLDDGNPELRDRRLERFAQELELLGGAYITAEDVGTTTEDMDFLAAHTRHVVGRTARSGIGGDPSPDTARTVLHAIQAALSVLDGTDDLDGTVVGILGLGKVGGALALSLVEQGATVVAYDPAVRALDGVELVDSPAALLERELDVLAPCALGGLIDEERAGQLRCRVVCGAANNPLTGVDVATALAARGVLYVPDFLANCGGLVRADGERRQVSGEEVERNLDEAAARTREILDEAVALGELPLAVAERHASSRIEARQRREQHALGG
ncbi:MAG TPA: Glu/Leu/Phe/Val dehydrogenase dimerization domain-containing protein [Solirubrobacterales bacterium]|jgi:glutamate dehydrogenase/leucine dehydrogenase|nr:Glu/Leu/Phe/Val dehydrogenase dimerization domain-containing protein [Solirubrobacterales bacterium]